MLSRKSKYGLIACVHLARHYGEGNRLIETIASEERLPRKFLEAILLELRNARLLQSKKGKGGGYTLANSPSTITVGKIVRVLDGPLAPIRCARASNPIPCEECRDPDNCGVRAVMRDAREALALVLDRTTLAQVVQREASMKLGRSGKAPIDYEI